MTVFPDDVDSLSDPVLGDPLSLSNGKSQPQFIKDLNDPVEAMERILVGPAFQNPNAATATPAVSLANCTSLGADGPRTPAATWTSYGEYATAGPALSIGSTGGSHVQAVITPPNDGWVVCNLGADYTLVNALALTIPIYPDRSGGSGNAETQNSIRENMEILVSDTTFTGINAADSTPIIAGNTVTSVPNSQVFEITTNVVTVGLGSLTKIRSIAIHLHDISDYSSILLRIGTAPIEIRANTELEAAIATGPTVVPASYAPSGTQLKDWSLGNAQNPVVDLRPGYQIIYNQGGEHHIREAQLSGYEDGSVDAAPLLRRVINGLKPHEKLVFPPNATYLLGAAVRMMGLSDIEIDFNGATFFKDGTTYDTNTPYIQINSCKRMKIHGFRLFGHFFRNFAGSSWTALTGTSVVGTTRTFSAQNHAAKVVPTYGPWLARDKDGYFIATFILSATTPVAKDCRVLLQTGQGTTLGYKDLTLTTTPTTYTVKIKNSKYLHEPMQWQIKKMTAGTSTITLTNSSLFGSQQGAGGGLPWEAQNGVFVRGSSDDIEVYDWTAEGIPTYVTQLYCDQGYGRNINIHHFKARCLSIQGLGFISGGGPMIHDNFYISEISGNAIDLEPNGTSEICVQPRITNGVIRNVSGTALVDMSWWKIHDIFVDNIKVIDSAWGLAYYGFGGVGGSISNIDASQHSPTADVDLTGPAPGENNYDELLILSHNVHWNNIHLSRGFRVGGTGATTFGQGDEFGYYDDGVRRYYEAGNNLIENIFIDGGLRSYDWTNAQVDGGVAPGSVLYNFDGGSNILRNITFASQAPLANETNGTARFITMPGVPEFHGLEARPWQRAAPHVYRAAEIGTPAFTPGGTQAFSQPVYDVQSLSGATATPVVWIPAGTAVAAPAVAGTPTIVNGPSFAVAPDGVLEANCEVAESPGLISWYDGSSTYRGVGFVFQGSMDNVTWRTLVTIPETRIGGGMKRVRCYTGPFLYARMYATNYDPTSPTTVTAVGNWVGSRGNNLRMLNVPVTAGATTLAVTFPTKVVPPTKTWTATAATGGSPASSLTAGAYSYRVGLRGPHSGPGVPDAGHTTTVVTNGSVDLKADIGVPDPTTGWFANALTVFRKIPGQTNYTQRADIIPVDPHANYHPFGSAGAWRDYGPYMRNTPFGLGYAGAYDWVTIAGGGYSDAQLNTHDESGWEPDTNYGVICTPSWGTDVAVPNKRVSGPDLAFGTACPGGGGSVDLFFPR